MADKTILVVGTYDTKDDELTFLARVIRGQGRGCSWCSARGRGTGSFKAFDRDDLTGHIGPEIHGAAQACA